MQPYEFFVLKQNRLSNTSSLGPAQLQESNVMPVRTWSFMAELDNEGSGCLGQLGRVSKMAIAQRVQVSVVQSVKLAGKVK